MTQDEFTRALIALGFRTHHPDADPESTPERYEYPDEPRDAYPLAERFTAHV
jgi:hypothetical protein